jgi:hypothetical protein
MAASSATNLSVPAAAAARRRVVEAIGPAMHSRVEDWTAPVGRTQPASPMQLPISTSP